MKVLVKFHRNCVCSFWEDPSLNVLTDWHRTMTIPHLNYVTGEPKMALKRILLSTSRLACFQLSARSWNPSLQFTQNHSSSLTASSQIINSDSDLVTLPWTCGLYSPNNGGRLQYQTWDQGRLSGHISIILKSPASCLPKESKDNTTLGLLTSSTLVDNVWLSTKPFISSPCQGWSIPKQLF